MNQVTKAVIPVAGWGTRMLPLTKAIEKSMLPIGDRPLIDYVVQDIIKAGITDIYFIVSQGSSQIQQYYGQNEELNTYLRNHNKQDKLELVEPPKGVNFHFITQPNDGRYGTSVPVSLATEFIKDDEMTLVVMGDQFLYRVDGGSNADNLIKSTINQAVDGGLIGVPIPDEDVSKYGIIDKDLNNLFVRVAEKPKPEDAPSNLNNASFYLFKKRVFELAGSLPANPARGEFELTDAINEFVKEGNKLIVVEAVGDYLDGGSLDGWLRANNLVALNS